MTEDDRTLLCGDLVHIARRLRYYEAENRFKANGPQSMVERIEAEQNAATDCLLAIMAENAIRLLGREAVEKSSENA